MLGLSFDFNLFIDRVVLLTEFQLAIFINLFFFLTEWCRIFTLCCSNVALVKKVKEKSEKMILFYIVNRLL